MKKVIWKYTLPVSPCTTLIGMPKGAKILSVDEQRGRGIFWAIVDPKAELETVEFDLFFTGENFEANYYREYIGTFTRPANGLVFHVFRRINEN